MFFSYLYKYQESGGARDRLILFDVEKKKKCCFERIKIDFRMIIYNLPDVIRHFQE